MNKKKIEKVTNVEMISTIRLTTLNLSLLLSGIMFPKILDWERFLELMDFQYIKCLRQRTIKFSSSSFEDIVKALRHTSNFIYF